MTPRLDVRDLRAGYGDNEVLQGVSLAVGPGQAAALLGRNGMGKTTLVHAIMGLVTTKAGTVRVLGEDVTRRPAHDVCRAGASLVPQGRRVFPTLTVEENLSIAERPTGEWTRERVYGLLPRLYERRTHRGDQLSGGEQQMVAIGRALLGNPKLLLLDEPSDGLAPKIVDEVTSVLVDLRATGLSILLVEQNLQVAMALADSVAIMVGGQIAYRNTLDGFRRDPQVVRPLLGVG